MHARFSTDSSAATYDDHINRSRLCTVSNGHYLIGGVSNLWNAAVNTFADGWQGYARPLAYLWDIPTAPLALEEDALTAGSRIMLHDNDILNLEYDDSYDTIPDKNFRFVYNLCTVFPQ